MNLLKKILLLSALINGALLVSSVNANDPHISYTYVDAGYVYLDVDDVDGFDVDGNGWGVTGSAAIHPNVYLFAGYSDVGVDFDIDVTTWDAGVGLNFTVADKTSLFATVAYADGKAESGSISVDDNGYALGAGIRYMLITDGIRESVLGGIEFQGGIDYVDLNDFGDDTSLSAGVLFHVNSFVAIGLTGAWGSDTSGYGAGFRFTLD